MKVTIHAVGKILKNSYEHSTIAEYSKRIRWGLDIIEYPSSDKKTESLKILSNINSKNIICLDERGKNIDSNQFALLIEKSFLISNNLNFIIGGAEGLDESARNASNEIISFGKLTWPHKMVRVMLAEQIYRAYSILNNHPYHK